MSGDPSPGQEPSTGTVDTPAANTAAVVTLAAVAGQRHRITAIAYSYTAAPAGGTLTVVDGATPLIDIDVTSSGEVWAVLPPGGLVGTANTAMTITLTAGGAGISGKLSVGYLTR